MLSLPAIFGVIIATVIAGEFVMWRLFRQRIKGILFPHAADTSQLRFFSVPRVRACAMVHTFFVLFVCLIFLLEIW